MARLQARLRVRGPAFAIGLVLGLALSISFLVWAVPEFRSPAFTAQYYEQWQAAAAAGDQQQQNESHFWVREFYGWIYAEDSLAQWLMALLGIVATVVSVYALVWIGRTWDQARKSANAAIVAAEAAVQANIDTREVSQRQLRAYVTLDDIRPVNIGRPNHTDDDLRIYIRWKNAGQTPARNIRWDVNHGVFNVVPADFDFPPSKSAGIRQATMGPGQITRDISHLVAGVDASNAGFRDDVILVWGWIEYSDAFNGTPRHRTEFCVAIDITLGDKDVRKCEILTDTDHNGADDDCLKQPLTTG
jgi:hypothetical protein